MEKLQEITATDDKTLIAVEIPVRRSYQDKIGDAPSRGTAKTQAGRVTMLYDDWNNDR